MKKAYIFDLDGTLANTIYDIGDSVNYILAQRGLPLHTYDEYLTYMGMGIGVTLSRAMPGYDDLPPDEQAALRNAYVVHNGEHCLDKVCAYDGMTETLEALQAKGVVLGIFTNKPEALGIKIAASLFKGINFAFIYGGLEGTPLKPDPERVLTALKGLGIAAADTVMVGDGKPDIITGKKGGFFCCGVSWGFKGLEELEGADIIIDHPRELLDIN